ncbi:hypothetical protein [Ensifer sp. Root142]|uniref:hypothetical protein n=1 Tax=Ensifer sp. Root142 TaxID=1736461 RepID=UPI0009E85E91|nr:hypothetical protein [Ensifer sp. Root142]MDP9632152.1 hypothetical protein [Ensifer adhaerens]
MRKIVAISVLLASFLPGIPLAQDIELYIDRGGPRYNDGPRYYDEDYRDYRAERRYCSPRRALAIAREQGLPGAQIGRTTNRWIEIRGTRGRSIVFGLSPRCPILGYND